MSALREGDPQAGSGARTAGATGLDSVADAAESAPSRSAVVRQEVLFEEVGSLNERLTALADRVAALERIWDRHMLKPRDR